MHSLWKGESWREEERAVKEKQKSKAEHVRIDPVKKREESDEEVEGEEEGEEEEEEEEEG